MFISFLGYLLFFIDILYYQYTHLLFLKFSYFFNILFLDIKKESKKAIFLFQNVKFEF